MRLERCGGTPLDTRLLGTLTCGAQSGRGCPLAHDTGVLAATTAFGKTVVARRSHSRARLATRWFSFIAGNYSLNGWSACVPSSNIDPKQIGVIGGREKQPTGVIDVALIQSLVRNGEVSDLVPITDISLSTNAITCPPSALKLVARAVKAKYVVGLSATVTRKDGHHPIIFMQCGPIRYRVDARRQPAARPFSHQVVIKRTAFHAGRQKADTLVSNSGALRPIGARCGPQ